MTKRTASPGAGSMPASKIRPTKGGKVSATIENGEHLLWGACLTAALTGILAAQRRTPNPRLVARLASKVADQSIEEARLRTHQG